MNVKVIPKQLVGKCYLVTVLLSRNLTSLLLTSVKSTAIFSAASISELFHSPSVMCLILLQFTSFLLSAFSDMPGLSRISDESYASQKSLGDLKERKPSINIIFWSNMNLGIIRDDSCLWKLFDVLNW